MEVKLTDSFKQDMTWLFSEKPLYRILRFFSDIPFKLKKLWWFFVRGRNGWAPNDTWDFDDYLARVIEGGVKEIQKHKQGIPVGICPACEAKEPPEPDSLTSKNCTCEKVWDEALDFIVKNIRAFHRFDADTSDEKLKLMETDFNAYIAKQDEALKAQEDALKTLTKYFNSLWT